jgi:hypothetical protein
MRNAWLARGALLFSCLSACSAKDEGPSSDVIQVGSGGGGSANFPKPCADIYDPDLLPTFELEVAADQLALLEQDCKQQRKEYRSAIFRYGSESAEVMVRLKGNWSYRCEKKQFVISFNETNPDGRFHGLRKIVLDAPWYDPSLLAERLGFSFMRRSGNYWSCANTARLMLNGEYYGAYTNVERLDKEYLQRHFPKAESDGNLYEAGKELKTNETVNDTSRRDALMGTSDVAVIAALADLDEAVKEWASLAMLPDPDSYWAGVEINYYIYDHPTRGFLWLPVDMDLTMRQGAMNPKTSTVQVGVQPEILRADPFTYQNPDWGREALYRTVLSDATWCKRFIQALKHARDAYDVAAMTRDLDTWAAQIEDAVAQDQKKPYTMQNHLDGVATLKAFMPQRLAFVDAWLETATCPVTHW